MFSIKYFIISVFCKIEKLLKEAIKPMILREKGIEPDHSDSKVITMEIVTEYQEINIDIGV